MRAGLAEGTFGVVRTSGAVGAGGLSATVGSAVRSRFQLMLYEEVNQEGEY
jgi:hypothetical protein